MSTFIFALCLNLIFFYLGVRYGKWLAMTDVFYKASNGIHIYKKGKAYEVKEL